MELVNDLSRFFASFAFDAPRSMAIKRMRDGVADVEDRRVLRERLETCVRNGGGAMRGHARKLLERLSEAQ